MRPDRKGEDKCEYDEREGNDESHPVARLADCHRYAVDLDQVPGLYRRNTQDSEDEHRHFGCKFLKRNCEPLSNIARQGDHEE